MRVFQTEATQCKDCKQGKPGMAMPLTEAPVAALVGVRGTVGRGEVSFRRSRGTGLCGIWLALGVKWEPVTDLNRGHMI